MSRDTQNMSPDEYAAYMRARRGVLPKPKSTPIANPVFPAASEPTSDDTVRPFVQCCTNVRWQSVKLGEEDYPFGICLGCGSLQYNPKLCFDNKYRGTGRTTTLLKFILRDYYRTYTTYFLTRDYNFAEIARETAIKLLPSGTHSTPQHMIVYPEGGKIFFKSTAWYEGAGLRSAENEIVVYDHYQNIHAPVSVARSSAGYMR